MALTNTPSPFILHVFYMTMLWQLPLFLVLCGGVFMIQRRRRRISRMAANRTTFSRMAVDSAALSSAQPFTARLFTGRKILRTSLGVLWILDGLLQLQPDMSSEFVPDILNPIMSGQPPFLAHLLQPLVVIWSQNPIQFDLLAVWVQLFLGVSILFGGDFLWGRAALWGSIAWGFMVWATGEGFGGIFSGNATWLAGDPGAVLFYMVGAGFLLAPVKNWGNGDIFRIFRVIMSAVWLWAAAAQGWPASGFWTGAGLSAPTLSMAEMPQPRSMAAILYRFAQLLNSAPVVWNTVFILIMTALCVGWAVYARQRWVWRLTYAWLGFTWIFGQEFGVLGGLGTDPNASLIAGLLVYSVGATGVKAGFRAARSPSIVPE